MSGDPSDTPELPPTIVPGDSDVPGDESIPTTLVGDPTHPPIARTSRTQTELPTIPGYEILAVLGRGGMGVVFKARQTRLKRLVALKTILGGSLAGTQQVARFQSEAEAVARLQHPNIVQIHEIGEHAGNPYFSMELVEGGSLDKHLAGKPQPAQAAAGLVETLARAMHVAHRHGIVHRDLKPANILLASGEAEPPTGAATGDSRPQLAGSVPKITDFGLAKQLDSNQGQTHSGAILGTPSYMAPEQALGDTRAIGPSADIYALGAMLYEMLTGRPPFVGETPIDTMLQVARGDPVPPRRLQPKAPADLETICLKCLEKDRSRRYESAEALADDLRRFQGGEPIQARASTSGERIVKWARRRPAAAALVAVSGLAALVLLLVVLLYNGQLRNERDLAQQLRDIAEAKTGEALQQAQKAEEARRDAVVQQGLAEDRAARLRNHYYAATMHLAYQAFGQGSIRRVLQMLDEFRPGPGQEEMRGFEWYYLWQLCHRDSRTVAVHPDGAQAVALLDTGALMAAGGDGQVKLWESASAPARIIPLAGGSVGGRVSVFSSDGQLVATAYADGTIKVWELSSGKLRADLKAPASSGILCLAFAPDGKSLVSGGRDYAVRCWDLETGKQRAAVRRHRGEVFAVAYSPDGSRIASAGPDATVRLWEPATLAEQDVYGGLPGYGYCLAFAPDGNTLALGCVEQFLLFDLAARKEAARLPVHLLQVRSLLYSPDGKSLALGTGYGPNTEVQVWDPATKQKREAFKGHTGDIISLAFTRDGRKLASGSADGTAKVWDATTPPNPHRYAWTLGPVPALAVDDASQTLAFAAGNTVQLWDFPARRQRTILQDFQEKVVTLAIASDGKLLATGEGGYPAGVLDADPHLGPGLIKLWELPTGKLQATLKGHTHGIFSVAFSPDGRSLASGSWDKTVRLWDVVAGKERMVLEGHSAMVRSVAFSPDGKLLAAACGDRWTNVRSEVRLWDAATGKELAVWWQASPAYIVTFSPDGKTLAAGTVGGAIQLWDVATRKERVSPESVPVSPVYNLAFTPDSRTLATAHANGTLKLWHVATAQEFDRFVPFRLGLLCVRFTSDGRHLVASDAGGSIWIWNGSQK